VVMAHDDGRDLLARHERVAGVDARERGRGAAAGLEHDEMIVELDDGPAVVADPHVPDAVGERRDDDAAAPGPAAPCCGTRAAPWPAGPGPRGTAGSSAARPAGTPQADAGPGTATAAPRRSRQRGRQL